MKTTEIKAAKPEGKMTQVATATGTSIVFENGVSFKCANSKELNSLWRKLYRMGFEQDLNFSSDESTGVIDAANKGENPFAFSVICSDPKLNEVVK